jgi:tyrosine-protein kinase Etk/Wzc
MGEITRFDADSTALVPAPGGTPGFGPADLRRSPWGVLRRNRVLIASSVIVILGATFIFTSRLTPVFSATSSIRIDEKETQLPALDILRASEGNVLETEMQMLQSRTLAESVVDSLQLQLQVMDPAREARADLFADIRVDRGAVPAVYWLKRQPDGHFRLLNEATDTLLANVAPSGELALRGMKVRLAPGASEYESIEFQVLALEDAVALVQAETSVTRRDREASMVDLTFEGTDPALVRDVANLLTSQYIVARRNAQQTETRTTANFLREQIAKLSEQLKGAEDSLRLFREREQVVSLKDEASTGVSQLADVRARRNAIQAERNALKQVVDQVQASVSSARPDGSSPYRDLVAFPTLLSNRAAVELLGSLVATEDRRADLLTRRTLEDPDVQALTGRIRQLELELQSTVLTYLSGLGSQVEALDSVIANSQSQLNRIPFREERFARLDRNAQGLESIVTLLTSRLKEAEIAEAAEDASVRLVDPAILPSWPVRPNMTLSMLFALVAGLALGVGTAFLREYRDRSVHTRRDVLVATGAPVLGLMPHARHAGRWAHRLRSRRQPPRRITQKSSTGQGARSTRRSSLRSGQGQLLLPGSDPQMPLAEANNSLATNLSFARSDVPLKVVVVTSPLPGDGKTTSAVNLAITMVKRGRRVLLVDADLRRGVVNTLLGLQRAPGLSSILSDGADWGSVIQRVALGDAAELHVMATGPLPANPAMLLASATAQSLFQTLREEYDMVIVDSPPANVAADAALLGTNSDGVIIVARAGVTPAKALEFTMEQLQAVRAPVLGGILNDIDFERDATYDGTYRYSGYDTRYASPTEGAL